MAAVAHRSISITAGITLKFVSTSLIQLLSYFQGSDVSYQIDLAHSTPAVAFLTGPVFSPTEPLPRLHNPTALSSAPLTPPHTAWVLLCSKLHSSSLFLILSLPSVLSSHPQSPGQAGTQCHGHCVQPVAQLSVLATSLPEKLGWWCPAVCCYLPARPAGRKEHLLLMRASKRVSFWK